MQRKGLIVGLITMAMFLAGGLVACSDDDNPTDAGDGGLGASDEGTANALAYDLALPLIQALNIGPFLDQLPALGTVNPNQCQPLDVCSSGSAMVCPSLGAFVINFTDCNSSGLVIDGSVSMEGDGTAGSGIMSLTLGDFTLAGTMSYTNISAENCFSQGFSNVAVTAGNLDMTMSGSISYCPPNNLGGVLIPSFAQIEIQIPGLNRRVEIVIFDDPVGELSVVVWPLGGNTPVLICDGNILGSLSCFTGTE